MPLAGHGLRPAAFRRRAGRPQLKRDPLGVTRLAMKQATSSPSPTSAANSLRREYLIGGVFWGILAATTWFLHVDKRIAVALTIVAARLLSRAAETPSASKPPAPPPNAPAPGRDA